MWHGTRTDLCDDVVVGVVDDVRQEREKWSCSS